MFLEDTDATGRPIALEDGDLALVMSNGSFDGLVAKLVRGLEG